MPRFLSFFCRCESEVPLAALFIVLAGGNPLIKIISSCCRPLWRFTIFCRCETLESAILKAKTDLCDLHLNPSCCLWYSALTQCLPLPQKKTCLHLPVESAPVLALCNWVPEKRRASLFQAFKFLIISLLCTRAVQDPLVHHGRHFGRAVHAFCNVQTLIANGLQAMCDDIPLDENLTAACVTCAILCR